MYYIDGNYIGRYTLISPFESLTLAASDSGLSIKNNLSDSTWIPDTFEQDSITDIRFTEGGRFACVSTGSDKLYFGAPNVKSAKSGFHMGLNWVLADDSCKSFDVSEDMIVVVREDSKIVAKKGLYDSWVLLGEADGEIRIIGDRIYLLTDSGELYVKQGMYGCWIGLMSGCKDFDADGEIICAISENDDVYRKNGIYNCWTPICSDVSSIEVSGDTYFATVGDTNSLYVKQGGDGVWVLMSNDVNKFSIEDDRIAVLAGDSLFVKSGIYGTWIEIADNAIDYEISGSKYGFIDSDNVLHVKKGTFSCWNNNTLDNVSLFAFSK